MSKSKISKATHGSPEKQLHLGDRDIQCYVLEDGMAVLSGRGLSVALNIDPKSETSNRRRGGI